MLISTAGSLSERVNGLAHLVVTAWRHKHKVDGGVEHEFSEFRCLGAVGACVQGFVTAVNAVSELPWSRVETEIAVIDLEFAWKLAVVGESDFVELFDVPDTCGNRSTLSGEMIREFLERFYRIGSVVVVASQTDARMNEQDARDEIGDVFERYPYKAAVEIPTGM